MEVCNLVGWKSSIKHNYMPIFWKKSKNRDRSVCDAPDELDVCRNQYKKMPTSDSLCLIGSYIVSLFSRDESKVINLSIKLSKVMKKSTTTRVKTYFRHHFTCTALETSHECNAYSVSASQACLLQMNANDTDMEKALISHMSIQKY